MERNRTEKICDLAPAETPTIKTKHAHDTQGTRVWTAQTGFYGRVAGGELEEKMTLDNMLGSPREEHPTQRKVQVGNSG